MALHAVGPGAALWLTAVFLLDDDDDDGEDGEDDDDDDDSNSTPGEGEMQAT